MDGSGAAPYEANTMVEGPHKGDVTAPAYHPQRHAVVTTSSDGEFKLWVRARPPPLQSALSITHRHEG